MKLVLERLCLYRLKLPLLSPFEHAGASREQTDNVVCGLFAAGGHRGFGEAVPRAYVTGETPELCWELLREWARNLPRELEARSADDALALARQLADAIGDRPGVVVNATRCAAELAVADLVFRALGTAVGDALSHRAGLSERPQQPNLDYSLVAGKGLLVDASRLGALRDRFGYRAVKAKVGFGLQRDLEHLARVREVFGPAVDLRVDANRAFSYAAAVEFLASARSLGIKAIEDPLEGDLQASCGALARLRAETGCEIVLDEPVRTLEEAAAAIAAKAVDVVSLRVSKCGGLSRCADIARHCASRGVALQLGCQVGETAILSAAGRCLAQALGALRYLEGSNERLKFSIEHDVCEEDLTYGSGGRGQRLEGPGLGIRVLDERLVQLAAEQLDIAL